MRENVAERFYRELRVERIWEGTSEIQRAIIASQRPVSRDHGRTERRGSPFMTSMRNLHRKGMVLGSLL
jgi:hypothetical protein